MREEGEAERDLGAGQRQALAEAAEVSALGAAGPPRNQLRRYRNERGQREAEKNQLGPDQRRAGRQGPREQEREIGAGSRERPPQVVEHLPAADRRDPGPRSARAGGAADQPRQELPVAARPAVLTRRRDLVTSGKVLEELDVGDERGPREEPLEEIVAEQRVFRHPSLERSLEGVDVVDPLAGVRALGEEILVDVRDRGGIGIDAGGTGKHAPKERALALGGQGRRDPRLEDAVALDDATFARLEPGPVQRVRQGADEPRRGAARKLGIGVQRDHEANRRRDVGRLDDERGVGRAAQEAIELVQLAALALPAHPARLALAPEASAVEQMEARFASAGWAVPPVQLVDARARGREQGLVVGRVLRGGIRPVRQQREA